MANVSSSKGNRQEAADIVAAAGGKLVGRTRLQKLACLLELAGLGEGFEFHYRHFGPFSEDLSYAIEDATFVGLIREEELPASWGGTYNVSRSTLTRFDHLDPSCR